MADSSADEESRQLPEPSDETAKETQPAAEGTEEVGSDS